MLWAIRGLVQESKPSCRIEQKLEQQRSPSQLPSSSESARERILRHTNQQTTSGSLPDRASCSKATGHPMPTPVGSLNAPTTCENAEAFFCLT